MIQIAALRLHSPRIQPVTDAHCRSYTTMVSNITSSA
jgi:hypothetical protein